MAGVRAAGLRALVGATIHELRDLEDEDTLVEGILPSHRVMPRVALALIMGGQGSVQTAMASVHTDGAARAANALPGYLRQRENHDTTLAASPS